VSVVPSALAEDPFRGALEVARTATFSPEEWEAYERAKMAEQDARGALAVARQEGTEEGLAKGHLSGLAEGLAEGLAKGHESGLAAGLAKGKREALLRLLARTGLVLTQKEHERIALCADVATLDRWFDNALAAKAIADVFRDS
jgi:flagellar biosynthesis/type III secretory pathway protein FliH